MSQTLRVQALKKNFMQYHEAGYTIPEIAKFFNVDASTIYRYLDEIADENNVTRESLLEKAPYNRVTSPASFHRDRVDIANLQNSFTSLENDLTQLIHQLDEIIKE